MGRPTTYNQDIADKIIHQISTTSLGLRTICRMDGMPNRDSVFEWLKVHKEFSDRYTRAKEMQIELIAEEMCDIADDGSNDLMVVTKPNGEQYEQENKEVTSRSKLRVETRKWLLSKLAPKKYGDKLDVTSNGETIAATVIPAGVASQIDKSLDEAI